MGVSGLTTYLREHRRVLGTTLHRASSLSSASENYPLVIDGWSLIYALSTLSNTNVNLTLSSSIAQTLKITLTSLHTVFPALYLVFDGPTPLSKHNIVSKRIREAVVKPGLVFWRTSVPARRWGFGKRDGGTVIGWEGVARVYEACMKVLNDLRSEMKAAKGSRSLHVLHADGEGDAYAVEVAARVGGYVLGNDSDFAVLNAEGYRGYVPIEDLVWSAEVPTPVSIDEGEEVGDSFQPVQHKRKKRPKFSSPFPASSKQSANANTITGRGPVPPQDQVTLVNLTLTYTVYTPDALASNLTLPISLLPLLGALAGNDFSQTQYERFCIVPHLPAAKRIAYIANTLSSFLPSHPHRATLANKSKQITSVMDLISATVAALLSSQPSHYPQTYDIDRLTEAVVESTLQYAIPAASDAPEGLWPSSACALHDLASCPLFLLFHPSSSLIRSLPLSPSRSLSPTMSVSSSAVNSNEKSDFTSSPIIHPLLRAYCSSSLPASLLNPLTTSTYFSTLVLDDPDRVSVSVSVGRGIRVWVYAVLDAVIGLPESDQDELDAEGGLDKADESDDDDDELVDVLEDSSEDEDDPLAPLRGALQRLHAPSSDPLNDDSSVIQHSQMTVDPLPKPRRKIISEFIRQGSRVIRSPVVVPSLIELIDGIGLPPSFLDFPGIPSIPSSQPAKEAQGPRFPALLSTPTFYRLTILLSALRSHTPLVQSLPPQAILPVCAMRWVLLICAENADEKGKWTRDEVRAALKAFAFSSEPTVGASQAGMLDANTYPQPITNRFLQLTAQLRTALDGATQLSQVLLLTSPEDSNASELDPGNQDSQTIPSIPEQLANVANRWRRQARVEPVSYLFDMRTFCSLLADPSGANIASQVSLSDLSSEGEHRESREHDLFAQMWTATEGGLDMCFAVRGTRKGRTPKGDTTLPLSPKALGSGTTGSTVRNTRVQSKGGMFALLREE